MSTTRYCNTRNSENWCFSKKKIRGFSIQHQNFQILHIYSRPQMCSLIFEALDAFTYTGWQRPIGCLKLQVIFRTRATDYRALLRKMTCKDKASYGSVPPCIRSLSTQHQNFPANEFSTPVPAGNGVIRNELNGVLIVKMSDLQKQLDFAIS